MNNKKIGNEWEQDFCRYLYTLGYWVHFLVPDKRGAQPFDVIAVKSKIAYAFDCKTCEADRFHINRLEDNQISAFESWLCHENTEPKIAVLHKHKLYILGYSELRQKKSILLKEKRSIDINGYANCRD